MMKLSKELRAAFTRDLLKSGIVFKIKKITLVNVNSYCIGLLAGGNWAHSMKYYQRIVVASPPGETSSASTDVLSGSLDIKIGDWVIIAQIQTEDCNFNFAIKNKGI